MRYCLVCSLLGMIAIFSTSFPSWGADNAHTWPVQLHSSCGATLKLLAKHAQTQDRLESLGVGAITGEHHFIDVTAPGMEQSLDALIKYFKEVHPDSELVPKPVNRFEDEQVENSNRSIALLAGQGSGIPLEVVRRSPRYAGGTNKASR